MVSRASFGGAIKPRRPVTEPLMLRIYFRFRGMADMAGLAVGLTQSRLTQNGPRRSPKCSRSRRAKTGWTLMAPFYFTSPNLPLFFERPLTSFGQPRFANY